MRTVKPLSDGAWKQYQRGLSRWENEGGSGPPAETRHPRALTFNKPELLRDAAGAAADSRER
jgi:hypothetical protein